jgi:hypothetical protein
MHERWPVLAPADAGRHARSDGDRSAPCSIAHLDFRNDSAFDLRPLREPPVRDHLPAAAHTDFSRTENSDCTCSASGDKPQPARRPFNLNAFSLLASPGAVRNRSQKRWTHVCSHICTRTHYLIHYFDLLDPPQARDFGEASTSTVVQDSGRPAQLGDAELGWSQGGYSHRRGAGRRMPVTAREYGACGTGRTLGVARVSFGYNSFESNDAIQCTSHSTLRLYVWQ